MRQLLWPLLVVCAMLVFMGNVDPARVGPVEMVGLSKQPGGTIVAKIDTLKLLVRDFAIPNTVADDSLDSAGDPWVFANSYYDTIYEASGDIRYGYVLASQLTTNQYQATGTLTGRRSEYDNDPAYSGTAYQGFMWFDTSEIPDGHRVENAYVIVALMRGTTSTFGTGGYISMRADTLDSDYAMALSTSTQTDPQWLDISWSYSDVTATTAFDPPLHKRDDFCDYGPRSDTVTWTSRTGGTSTPETAELVRFDVTDAVQQIVDAGDQDRGIIFVTAIYNTTAVNGANLGMGATYALVPSGNPVFTCVTTSRRGPKPWLDGAVVHSIIWDDNEPEDPDIYALYDSLGYEFTSAIYKNSWDTQSDSLWAANAGVDFGLLPHTKTHLLLGTMPENQVMYEVAREWIGDPEFSEPYPDTTALNDFVWVGGGTFEDRYSMGAIRALYNNNYRTARATSPTWHTGIGELTSPAWDRHVNLFAIGTRLGGGGFSILANRDTLTRAAFDDEFWDQVDDAWTNKGRSAVVSYHHGYSNGAGPEKLIWYFDNIESHYRHAYRPYGWVANLLSGRRRVDAVDVTEANGATASIAASAALYDSVKTADSLPWPDQVWVGPAGEYFAKATTPDPPTGLTLTPGDTQITLDWDDNREGDLAGYYVRRGTAEGITHPIVHTLSPSEYTDTGLSNGTTYYYRVQAYNDAGEFSELSPEVSGTPVGDTVALNAPSWGQYSSHGGSVNLEWGATAPDVFSDIASASVYREVVILDDPSGTLTLYDVSTDVDRYEDSNVTSTDSTYYYAVTLTDSSSNESDQGTTIGLDGHSAATDSISFTTFASTQPAAADTIAGDINLSMTATLNRAGYVRKFARLHDQAYPDSSEILWQSPAATSWTDTFDTGRAIANANADSGQIDLSWVAGTSQDKYLLEMSANGGAWVVVDSTISAGATTYDHDADNAVPPRRGKLDYRLRGVINSPYERSGVALTDSTFYNQAVEVFVKYLAVDSDWTISEAVYSDEVSEVYISIAESTADTTPPDTAGVFVSAVFDSSFSGIDLIGVRPTYLGGEQIQIWQQIRNGVADDWAPVSADWVPATATDASFQNSEYVSSTIEDAVGDTLYTRFKIRDVAGNETDWSTTWTDIIRDVFERRVPSTGSLSGYTVISNSTTAVDSTTVDNWVQDPTYCAAIDMASVGNTSTNVDWGTATQASVVPMGSRYGRTAEGGLHFSSGGNEMRSYPLFSFGSSNPFSGATVDSAVLHIKMANTAFVNIDSLFIWSCTGNDTWSEWDIANDDASYTYSGGTTAWTTPITNMTRADMGVELGMLVGGGNTNDITPSTESWVRFNVGSLVQDQIDNGKPIIFYFTFQSSVEYGYTTMYDNGHEEADQDERFYLEVYTP